MLDNRDMDSDTNNEGDIDTDYEEEDKEEENNPPQLGKGFTDDDHRKNFLRFTIHK
jgi:hypothetical protein